MRYIVLFPRKGKPDQPMLVHQGKDYSGPPDQVWRERPLCSLLYFSISQAMRGIWPYFFPKIAA